MTGRHEGPPVVRLLKLEPSAVTGFLQAGLALVASYWVGLTPGRMGAIMACVIAITACYQGLAVRPYAWPLITGAVQAGIALALAWGFDVSTDAQGAILAAVTAFGGLVTRSLVTPETAYPSLRPGAAP